MASKRPLVSLKNAILYQSDQTVLKGVNLEINEKDFFYIIGRTGSGKSTLLRTIYADIYLHSGIGSVLGYNLQRIKASQVPFLRRKLGIVFQDFQLLTDRNLENNLKFVLKATGWKQKSKIKNRIDEVLHLVGLEGRNKSSIFKLSGGEQQCVAIARALLNNPILILADEPTGNLDPETSEDILLLLKKINSTGTAIVMASHNYGLIEKHPSKTFKCEKKAFVELT